MGRLGSFIILGMLVGAGGVAGCSGGKSPAASSNTAAATARGACVSHLPGHGPLPVAGRPRASSPVALVQREKTVLAYVADEDDRSVHVVDVDSKSELSTLHLDGTPTHLLVAADGRVFVTLRDRAALAVLEPSGRRDASLASLCTIETAVEPVALALTPDDATLLVTAGWGHNLAAYATASGAFLYGVDVPREPRAVVVSDDGRRAFVSHAVGSALTAVELGDPGAPHGFKRVKLDGKDEARAVPPRRKAERFDKLEKRMPFDQPAVRGPRTSCQGFALAKSAAHSGRILAPQVLVDSGDAQERTSGYGSAGGGPTEVPDVAVIDEGTAEPLASSLSVAADVRGHLAGARECVLPRAAAVDGPRESLFVTCLGMDALVEYDASAAQPHAAEKRRWRVGSGPVGVAVDGDHQRAVVWSQFDRVVSVIPLGGLAVSTQLLAAAEPVVRVDVSRQARAGVSGDVALGRKIFHAAGDPRIASDGRACASCHPDGRDDAITWATPEGPRQTPMLAGRLAGTAPYAWAGNGSDIKVHLQQTFSRLRGHGLRDHELDSLVAYVTRIAPPPAPPRSSADAAKLARGAAIFHSAEAACGSCHGKDGVAPDGETHDVGSAVRPSDTGAAFDTPSLHLVGGTAPYFHDGRYATLRDLFAATDGKMGRTAHLSAADVEALETYVRSL